MLRFIALSAVFLLVTQVRPVAAESIAPATLGELLKADYVAVGRFVQKDRAIPFIPSKVLRGDAKVIDELRAKDRLPIYVDKDGKLTVECYSEDYVTISGLAGRDASATMLWFFSRSTRPVMMQPVELVPGFTALLAGKQPEPLFRLLQRLDFDLQREAMEELFAKRDKKLIAELHELALRRESLAVGRAVDVLIQTRLLDTDRFWATWTEHPQQYYLQRVLEAENVDRVVADLRKAIVAEKRPGWRAQLLQAVPHNHPAYRDVNLQYLDDAAAEVRERALWNVHDVFWTLARQSRTSAKARLDLQALGKRVLPLLEARWQVEKAERVREALARLLAQERGVPWLLRVPSADEALPPYAEAAELKILVGALTSSGEHGFLMASAGRHVAERFFDAGFAQLKAAAVSPDYNHFMVYEGMGYVRDPRVFGHLVEHLQRIGVGDSTFPATVRAIGIQNDKRSFGVLAGELIQGRLKGDLHEGTIAAVFDALGSLQDERTLDLLKQLEPLAKHHAKVPYLRARARHGDEWAVRELIAALDEPSKSKFLDKGWFSWFEVANSLVWVDGPDVTATLKRVVQASWPARASRWDGTRSWTSMDLQNYAGAARRSTPLAEIARRDPHWLAEFALGQMAAPTLRGRAAGAHVFGQLTGRLGDYRAGAFAPERAEPLRKLQAWWDAHKNKSRERWLLSYFQDKGFVMPRLHAPSSLPVLVRALDADRFTHQLAVEQISVIAGKFFTLFSLEESYRGQEQMTIRVVGWLKARQLL
jgi:hypothetical protein